MKKFVLITVAVLLLSVSVVSAQETETEVLNFYTVGSIFNWGDDAQAVYDYLTRFEGLELEIDEEYHSVSASAESDSETYMYNFLFDAETDKLYGIQCFASMTDEIDPAAVLQDLISNYGLDSAEAYEDEFLQETIADYDAGAVVAGPGTIVSIAGSAETEDTYAAISIAFYDRAYYENGNELPEFSFYTVGELFNWGDSAENVYNFISQYNGAEVEIDEEKHTITATSQSDAEKSSYVFWFDEKTDGLYGLQCITGIFDENDPSVILQDLIDNYDLENVPLYEDESLQALIEDYDAGAIAATDTTIVVLAGSEGTADTNALAAIYFFDRAYYESL